MEITININTENNYKMIDLIAAFHYVLQCGEEEMIKKNLNEYSNIIKDIRNNEPLIMCV